MQALVYFRLPVTVIFVRLRRDMFEEWTFTTSFERLEKYWQQNTTGIKNYPVNFAGNILLEQ